MIEVAAVVFRNSFGHVLTVRKESSTKFQLPGGKLEAGETVRGRIFTYPRPVLARAAAEIAEVAWVDPANPDRELAHLLRDEVFPALRP